MTKICLRCDWTGETKDRVCPSCGAALFRPPGAAPPTRRRFTRRPRRSRAEEAASATPPAESFDPSTPDEGDDEQPVSVARGGGWVAVALLLVVVAVVGVVVTRSSAPAGPIEGVQGDLVLLSSEGSAGSRVWIWDLATGAVDRGPVIDAPLELVDTYLAEPEGGWVGVLWRDGDEQVAGVLRNFAPTDVPLPLLRGDLVAWSNGGERVAAASKGPDPCSDLRVQSLRLGTGVPNELAERSVCGRLDALALDDLSVHVGMSYEGNAFVAAVAPDDIVRRLDGASLVAVSDLGGILVVPRCDAPGARPGTCGGLAYADPAFPDPQVVPFGEPGAGVLRPERFIGWSRDERTGYVVGTYDDVRGVYAVAPSRVRRTSPVLVLASLAAELHVAETTGASGRELFVASDGALVLIRSDGDTVPVALPDDIPAPEGPILWLPSVGGGG